MIRRLSLLAIALAIMICAGISCSADEEREYLMDLDIQNGGLIACTLEPADPYRYPVLYESPFCFNTPSNPVHIATVTAYDADYYWLVDDHEMIGSTSDGISSIQPYVDGDSVVGQTSSNGYNGYSCEIWIDPSQYSTWAYCGGSPSYEFLLLDVGATADDAGTYIDNDPVDADNEESRIIEHYVDSKQLTGNWTVQLIDGEGGDPLGPRTKSLTVCPGSWVRMRVDKINDEDFRVHQDKTISSVPESTGGPCCDGWSVDWLYYYDPVTESFGLGEGVTKVSENEFYYDQEINSSSSFPMHIYDVPKSITNEYIDATYTETLTVTVKELVPSPPKDTTGGSGCTSCGGDGLAIDLATGETIPPSGDLPAIVPAPLQICGTKALRDTPCGAEYFEKVDGVWECKTDPTITLTASGAQGGNPSSATITYSNGSYIEFKRMGTSSDVVGIYQATKDVDAAGQETTYDYDDDTGDPDIDTGQLLSATLPDGTVYNFTHLSGRHSVDGVIAPGDSVARMVTEFGTGASAELPTKVTLRDPSDPTNPLKQTVKTYTYDTAGKLTSFTAPSGLKTCTTWASGKVSQELVYNPKDDPADIDQDGNKTYNLYYRTGLTYPSGTVSIDDVDCGVTEIRHYANPGTVVVSTSGAETFSGSPESNNDRITKRYYYQESGQNTFLRASKHFGWDGSQFAEVQSLIYTVCTTPGWKYGKNESIKDTQGGVTTIDYYDPAVNYNVSNLDDAPYPTTNGTVPGNGEPRQVTLPNGVDSISNSYKVESGVMKPYTTIIKNVAGNITKYVPNSDGSVAEIWRQNDDDSLAKMKSYTYYSTPSTHKGLLNTETVYDVASTGSNRNMVTTCSYDFSNGQRTETVTVGGKSIISHYSVQGNMDWIKDERDQQTDLTYDYRGLNILTTFPQITGESVRKNAENHYTLCCGSLEWSQDENGHKTYHEYDGAGRSIKEWTDISGQDEAAPVEYVYNAFGEVVEEKSRNSSGTVRTTSYEYDSMGNVTKTVYPYGAIEGDLLGSEELHYDAAGRLDTKTDGNGRVTKYQYDTRNRVSALDYDYSGTFSSDVTYTYDGATENVLSLTNSLGTTSYTYDRQGRIKTYTPPVPVDYGTLSYTWNNLNQKTSMTVPLGTNNLGRKMIYSYDNTGMPIGTEYVPAIVTSSASLESVSQGDETQFVYDEEENRVKLINKAGDVYYFVYDPTSEDPSVVYEQGSTNRYLNIRASDGSLISREKYSGTGALLSSNTYHFDGLGNTVALSDAYGTITDKYEYNAWGSVSHTSGSTSDNPYQFVGQSGYYTHYQEPSLGLIQAGVRYYDPNTGRFTQRDALGAEAGHNEYHYVDNNPVLFVDPSGYTKALPGVPTFKFPPFKEDELGLATCNYETGKPEIKIRPGLPPCIRDAVTKHEEEHVTQRETCCKRLNQCLKNSKGKEKATLRCFKAHRKWEETNKNWREYNAYQAEINYITYRLQGIFGPLSCSKHKMGCTAELIILHAFLKTKQKDFMLGGYQKQVPCDKFISAKGEPK